VSEINPLFCGHPDTLPDDDGYAVCLHCHAAVPPPVVLTEQLLWDAADAVWAKDYHGPGLPPSFRRRLEP
jgi:hypothetical protein